MEWWSASEAAAYGAWRPPTSVAEPSASPSRLATELPPYIPSENDLNVLISAVESVASCPYDDCTPSLLPPVTPERFFAAPVESSPLPSPLHWDGAQFMAVGMYDQIQAPMIHPVEVTPHEWNQASILAPASPPRPSVAPSGSKEKKRAPASPPDVFASSQKSRGHRQCQVPDCTKVAQTKGRCVRHGGGKRCPVEGCSRGAQANGKCKAHGGGIRCMVEGCSKARQGGGLCRRHGGGKLCEFPGCTKGAQRKGKCARHKGVRVCSTIGCAQPAREGEGFCSDHIGELKIPE